MVEKKRIGFFDVINLVILLSFTFICIFPFYFMFINTISDSGEIARGNITFIPRGMHIQNYIAILSLPTIWNATLVSVARTVIGTFLTLFCCSFFAFLVTRENMFLRKFCYRFLIITMFFHAGLIPWFMTMRLLNLNDNFLLYVLPGAISAFNVILIKTYMETSIPSSLTEAATIDGASIVTVYWRIMLPLSKPILATIAVFTSVGQWNSFQDNLFLVHAPNLQTLQMLLFRYMNQVEGLAAIIRNQGVAAVAHMNFVPNPMAMRMTISMIVVFPIILVYPFLQRFFVKGIMIGAIKG